MFISGYRVFPTSCTRLFAVACLLGAVGLPNAEASFHLWDINEVYSNADGSVQYIELFTAFNSQQFTGGRVINTSSAGVAFNSFTFPSNAPSPTAGQHLLLATPGFAALPGAVTPDFTLPAGPFFDPNSTATIIDFVFADQLLILSGVLPTDGVQSLNRDLTTGTNSPTNFAGDTGQLGATLDGDLNGDGFVGVDDLNIVLVNWNQSVTPGDLLSGDPTGEGFVGVDDLNVVLVNWNNGTPPPSASVPEPVSLALLGIGAGTLFSRRK